MKKIGILALQGNYYAHAKQLQKLQIAWQFVLKPKDLQQVDGLVIPGGESTALLRLLHFQQLDTAIVAFALQGYPIFGTSAGMI